VGDYGSALLGIPELTDFLRIVAVLVGGDGFAARLASDVRHARLQAMRPVESRTALVRKR
jgi:hypothetical protein